MQSDSVDYSHAGDPAHVPGKVATTGNRLVLSAEAAAGERLDRFLARMLPQYSRSRLQQWIAAGAVRCNEQTLSPATRLVGHERIEVEPQERASEQTAGPEPIPLDVVYEDADLLVIDKPVGLVVHPAAGNWTGTLLNGLLHHAVGQAALPRGGIVHRLDKDTSGLMVVARSERAHQALAAQLAERSMGRRYLALVLGACPAEGSIEGPIGRDRNNRLRMAVVPSDQGRAARTDYRLLASGRIGTRALSLLECRLHSGRTHQIRVHLRSIGHVLVGDALYGGPAGGQWPTRQMLHAWRLRLRHPGDGEWREFRSTPPVDFRNCLELAGIETALVRPPESA